MVIEQIIMAGAVATCPTFFVKNYIKTSKKINIIVALLCYTILLSLYISIYRKTDISKAYISILTIQIILVTLIGILYFKEDITQNKIIGVIAGMTCIYFLAKK